MIEKASHIRDRFPDKSDTIELLMAEDPEFCEVCDDYETCVNALHYWAQSPESEAKTKVNEYRTIIQELEEEITEALVVPKLRRLD